LCIVVLTPATRETEHIYIWKGCKKENTGKERKQGQ